MGRMGMSGLGTGRLASGAGTPSSASSPHAESCPVSFQPLDPEQITEPLRISVFLSGNGANNSYCVQLL